MERAVNHYRGILVSIVLRFISEGARLKLILMIFGAMVESSTFSDVMERCACICQIQNPICDI